MKGVSETVRTPNFGRRVLRITLSLGRTCHGRRAAGPGQSARSRHVLGLFAELRQTEHRAAGVARVAPKRRGFGRRVRR